LVFARQYDYVGNLMKEIDPMGRETTYSYDSANRVVSKVDPQKTSSYEYYAGGLLKKETNSAGQRVDYIYDARGNKTEARNYFDASNYISIKFEYDGLNRAVKTIDGSNGNTAFVYDKLDRLTAKTAADGGITEYFYDNAGNKVGERGPRAQADASLRNSNGYSVTLVYNGLSQLTKAVNADDKVTLNFYDANGNPIKTIDRQEVNGASNTHQTQFEYYANNLKKKEIYADGGAVEFTYDKVGNLKTKKDQLNRTWTYNYDDFNRLIEELDPANNSTKNAFDKDGNKLSVTYPDNTKTEFYYNSANMLVSVKDAIGGETVFTYDAAGNKLTETDKRNLTTTFAYDKLNRLVSETNPQAAVSAYSYDNNGNRVSETVAGLTTVYEFDVMNRLTKITYPGNKTEAWTYDKDGNRLSFVNGNAQTITFAYDKLDRLKSKHLPDGAGFDVVYVYDNWNNLTRLIDQSGTTDYVYDSMNRNTSETKAINGLSSGKTVSRTYNLSGQQISLTDAANRVLGYTYNNRGMLGTVAYSGNDLAVYAYNSFGKPSTATFGNGVVSTYTYDLLNRTSAIETKNSANKLLFKQQYEYDAESNRAKMIETRVDESGTELQATVNYTYDSIGQLTLVDNPEESGAPSNDFAYAYDARGNRTTGTTPVDGAAYTYTEGTNELAGVSYNSGLMTVASVYDGAGSLVKETISRLGLANKEVNYAWTSEGRLASIAYKNLNRPAFMPALADNTLAFVYDDFGNRVKKTVNESPSAYYFNDGLTVLDELDADGNVQKTMVKGVDAVAEIDKDGIIQYVHADVLGSAVLLTDANGAIMHQYEYEAFGRMASDIGNIANETDYTFTNQEFDPESELYYYNARYYNPRLGRFNSRDTVLGHVGDSLSRNLYIYVKNNPLKYTDPTGNESESLYQSFVNNDYVQSIGGYAVGFGEGLYSTGELIVNANLHPIKFYTGMATSLKDTAVQAYNETANFIDDPGKAWNEMKAGLSIEYNEFANKSFFDQGRAIGFFTEKIMETVALTKGAGAAAEAGTASKVTTVYRVEGSTNTKILIDASGNVSVNATKTCLYINCGQIETSINFLKKKISGGMPEPQLKSFDVNTSFVEKLQREAVPQNLQKQFPNAPQRVDVTTGPDQFGLHRAQIQELKDNIIQGSGSILDIFK
jgi:RHS repeat-associated protein